ncbi:MAG TPA: AAA domain-containing protein [Candidatus Gastranaerophilales bacterium]|nr:AAA domain-containing protein [Candidatus Gastranaerophilales bacterium]
MLQEATKALNLAFRDNFIKKLTMYLHDCISEEVRSSSFKNLKQDKGNKWFFLENGDFFNFNPDKPIKIKNTGGKLAELMVQADVSKKDYQLIYGFLFLKGKSSINRKNEDFLTPLLYVPCRLERDGMDINCLFQDEYLSLNTSALVSLMEFDEEDETAEHLLDGLIDYIPEAPLTKEKINLFLNTLKAIIPDIEISDVMNEKEKTSEELLSSTLETLTAINVSSIILTKRPNVLAGLLHELSEISEKPVGAFRETALAPVHEEFSGAVKNKKPDKKGEGKKNLTITPLDISKSQEDAIEALKNNTIVTVFGPPGTGKSQTIVNIASHLIGSGKTVLVASKMDKAVDVVSERLNGFGAKFLCLRAGKPDYQKFLSNQLQDLISNKVDLEAGIESIVLTEAQDLEVIVDNKRDFEKKCAEILRLENEWYRIFKEYEQIKNNQQENNLINTALYAQDIHNCRLFLNKIENLSEKPSFINNLQLNLFTFILTKKIKTENKIFSCEVIEQLRQELNAIELKEKLKKTEIQITRNGNLTQIFDNLKDLRIKYKKTAVEILKNKRREALKALIRDQYKRQRLIIHSKALVERKKNIQNRIMTEEDFSPLLETFPCWAVTNQVVSESLPLEAGLFDVAIIDESSQCDIAGCIPILFRAKKAIIVGDDKQLPHLSFLEKAKEQSFLNKYNIPDKYQLMWRFRTNSMFDVANYYASSSVLLDEHFRCFPEIINFSNTEFYGNRMKIMKKNLASRKEGCCIELNVIDNAKVDLDSTRNMPECEKIIDKVHQIINENNEKNPDNPCSIGIISPFRGQVELIKKALYQVFTSEIIKKHQIEAGTAHTFQGDERDIVLLSFTIAANSHFQSITFAQKPNLFNVAVTRARKKLICYISRPPESLPDGLLRNYLEYIQIINKSIEKGFSPEIIDPVKKELKELLENEDLIVSNDIEIGGYPISLAVSGQKNTILLETIGFDEENKNDFTDFLNKHQTLERCGWNLAYVTSREWNYSKKACISRLKTLLY